MTDNLYNILTIITFIIGYFFITIEHRIGINKTAIALLMAIICWVLQFLRLGQDESKIALFAEHISDISQVVFFLLGALAIVETISAHKSFNLIAPYIRIQSKLKLLWIVCLLTFFLSAILDNLTTTIIMVTFIRKLVNEGEERLLLGGAIVIAANAGGAWTPIGDITTTMLWIGGHISSWATIRDLIIPSLACLVGALLFIGRNFKGSFSFSKQRSNDNVEPYGKLILFLGIGSLVSVPLFKILTGLPPFMGMLLGLSVLWIVTDYIHEHDKNGHLKLPNILTKSDYSSVLFFLGILLCIDALDAGGILEGIAHMMDKYISFPHLIAVVLGLISAVVDNVPLVAAIMNMYDVTKFPMDSSFWQLVAYCAGTGGSILVIGSAAGVAFMGLEKVEFFWYLRRIGIPAFIGYLTGIGIYWLLLAM